MKYLVIGTGGTGGLIGGFLAKNQLDITLIACGEHLKAIQNQGLTILMQHTRVRRIGRK